MASSSKHKLGPNTKMTDKSLSSTGLELINFEPLTMPLVIKALPPRPFRKSPPPNTLSQPDPSPARSVKSFIQSPPLQPVPPDTILSTQSCATVKRTKPVTKIKRSTR